MTPVAITHILMIIITVFISDCFQSLHWNFLVSFDFFVTPGQNVTTRLTEIGFSWCFPFFHPLRCGPHPTFTLVQTAGFTVEAGCYKSVILFSLISTSERLNLSGSNSEYNCMYWERAVSSVWSAQVVFNPIWVVRLLKSHPLVYT